MTRNFLPLAMVLALVGGANAQSLSDRLAGWKPKVEPKADHPFPFPFKTAEPEKKLILWNPEPLAVLPGRATGLMEGNGPNPFAQFPGLKPTAQWEPNKGLLADFGKPLFPLEFVRPMDTAARPVPRAIVLGWKKDFPNLGDDFEVQAAGTPNPTAMATRAGTDKCIPGTYNCIAHTAGIKNVWVNPYQKGDAWDLYYGPLGYAKATGTDTGHEKGVQKVAVYATRLPNGKLKEYTHAAVQEIDGTWTSKLGSGPLIRHRTAEAVGGGTYGEVVRVYARPR